MPYQMQNKTEKFSDFTLTPEELDVRDALKVYEWNEDCSTPDDFVPTRVLYGVYAAYIEQWGKHALTPTQFGCALRRAFGLDPGRKARRRIGGGPAINGYTFVKLKEKNARSDPAPVVQTACPRCGGVGTHYLDCTGIGD